MRIHKRYAPDRMVVLHHGTAMSLLAQIPNDKVSLTFTSPPYCMGKEYESTNRVEDFIDAHKLILPEVVRVTAPGGSICWQIGYHVNDGALTPLDFLVHEIMSKMPGITLRNRIVWTYGHGLHCSERLSGRHETVLWYTKGKEHTFNLDAIRIPQKYPGKRHYKGPNKGKPSSNPRGKNPSDVWDIPNVKANHIEKTVHPCQFPIALAMRAIRAFSSKNDLVLDPFAGSGTTAAATLMESRRFVGAEVSKKYFDIAQKRCLEALSGELKFRPLDQPIYIPNPNSTVAKQPEQAMTIA